MKIWSKRWSFSYGNHWIEERKCDSAETAKAWLTIFQADEPKVIFIASSKKPR